LDKLGYAGQWLQSTRNFQVTVRFSPRVICKQPWASC